MELSIVWGVRRCVEERGVVIVFFLKQKTAYEIKYGLVGTERCIRGRIITVSIETKGWYRPIVGDSTRLHRRRLLEASTYCTGTRNDQPWAFGKPHSC